MAIRIVVGSLADPDYEFDDRSVFEAKTNQKVSLSGSELTVDTFEPVVSDDITKLTNAYIFRSSDSQVIETLNQEIYALDISDNTDVSALIDLEYGTPVWYYRDDVLIGKFYINYVDRVAKNQYRLYCVSVIGLLDKMYHGGGFYQASTFQAVLSEILASDIHGTGTEVIDYEIDDDVAAIPVSGWLPKATKRENLYQLVFSCGVNIIKNVDGNPRFTFIYTAPDYAITDVELESTYDSGSVKYEKPYSKVSVTEHTYTALTTEDPQTLFDNTNSGVPVTNEEVWFTNAPVIVSTITASGGLTLVSATVNSAIVSGNGKLEGVPYTHTTRVIEETITSDNDKVASVDNCTLINLINSQNTMLRLQAYYQPNGLMQTVRNSIIFDEERTGKAYGIINPFQGSDVGYLSSMEVTASSVFKADCEWRVNYAPAGQQGLYQNVEILVPEDGVYTGTWEVPDDVTEFKIVLISGGTGGTSGYPGNNGGDAFCHTGLQNDEDIQAYWYGAEGGDGGAGGNGGNPGKVLIQVVENAVSGTTYNYTLGQGGDGGDASGFKPDTVSELRNALANEEPGVDYTDAQIQAMIDTEDTDWNGSPNAGDAGTDTSFGSYSTSDGEAYVPTGGIYEPITAQYFALIGKIGLKGGKGGARKIQEGNTSTWITDGEDLKGEDGTIYRGGSTGNLLTTVVGLSEVQMLAYGGNGAGAAVGIGRDIVTPETGLLLHPHINGGSDQETSWEVTEDS